MKLFKRFDHYEGGSRTPDAFVMFGRCYDSGTTGTNGCYISFASPFVRTRLYVCGVTFTIKEGPCRAVWQWKTRCLCRGGVKGKRVVFTSLAQVPA